MNQDQEIEKLITDNEKMAKALKDISEAPALFAARNLYTKRNQGALNAIRACAVVADNALKETNYGREENETNTGTSADGTKENQT